MKLASIAEVQPILFKYPQHVFLVSCGNGCKRITVSEIAYIEAMKDNCILHMKDETHHHLTCPMGDVEKDLNMDDFKRIHRSFIVNISFIAEYNFGSVVLGNGMVVPIGRKYINSVNLAQRRYLFSTSPSEAFWMESNNRSMSLLISTASLLLPSNRLARGFKAMEYKTTCRRIAP